MKNFYITLLCATFFSCHIQASFVVRKLVGATAIAVRQSGLYVGKKMQDNPDIAAGALVGAYVGYKISRDDARGLGMLAGAVVGACLVKDHKAMHIIKAQLQTSAVKVSELEMHVALKASVLQNQINASVRQFGKQLSGLEQKMRQCVKRRTPKPVTVETPASTEPFETQTAFEILRTHMRTQWAAFKSAKL